MIRSNIRNDISKFVGGTGVVNLNLGGVPLSEVLALMNFYEATDGPNWTNNTGWLTDPVVGNWYGVTVVNGHVTHLDLNDNGVTLSGPGLQYLSGLTRLTTLYLNGTGVTGDIVALTGLTGLTSLRLHDTGVAGDIVALTGLTGLTQLYLYGTGVAGDIATLSYLRDLTILYLQSTGVTGDIAALIGLTRLTTLYLHNTGVNVNTVPVFSMNSGTLLIHGSNPAPDWGTVDSPSQVALNINALLIKQWVVTVTGAVPQWVINL